MRGWYDLPPELRREIIKYLDFYDRFLLRRVSQIDREIVDTVRLSLPRVIFDYRFGKFLLKVYSGIDTYRQFEYIRDGEKNCIRYGYVSGATSTIRLELPYSITVPLVVDFQHFLMVPNIHVDTLEWGLNSQQTKMLCDASDKNMKMYCSKLLNRQKAEGINRCIITDSNENRSDTMTGMSRTFERTGVTVDNFVPRVAVNNVLKSEMNTNCFICELDFCGDLKPDTEPYLINFLSSIGVPALDFQLWADVFCVVNSDGTDTEKLFNSLPEPTERLNDKVVVKKRYYPSKTEYMQFNLSSCGLWVFPVTPQNKFIIPQFTKNNTCGLGPLCSKCADPFDHWYMRNLAYRLKYDKFWTPIDAYQEAVGDCLDILENMIWNGFGRDGGGVGGAGAGGFF